MTQSISQIFSLQGKLALVTGGSGVLCAEISRGLALAGAHVLIADLRAEAAEACAAALVKEGLQATGFGLDAMSAESLAAAVARAEALGGLDILVNGVGGNMKGATTSPEQPFTQLPREAMERVINLNLMGGALLPSQAFAPQMIKKEAGGVILNVSSMNAFRPLTRIPGYSAAKAAVSNFTQWLAVHLAQEYNPKLRVNAIAPGFFLTEQNRFLLTDEATGDLTARGRKIIDHTPMGRFGEPSDLVGTVLWLCSDAARFVTGIVVPIDGGFSAYSGV